MLLKKIIKSFLFFVALFFLGITLRAQTAPPKIPVPIVGSVEIEDSASLAKKKIDKKVIAEKPKPKPKLQRINDSFPDPNKAWKWALIPGGGQIYNNKGLFIRLPIVYGALAFGINRIIVNTNVHSNLEYNYMVKVDPVFAKTNPYDLSIFTKEQLEKSDASQLKQARDASYNTLQLSYILATVGYLLSGLEAFTTAHLAHFDVKDDIKFSFKPSIIETPITSASGFSFIVKF